MCVGVCTHVEGRWAIFLLWVHSTLMFGGWGLAIKLVYLYKVDWMLGGSIKITSHFNAHSMQHYKCK